VMENRSIGCLMKKAAKTFNLNWSDL
jgi:hypothetical protein